MLVSQYNSLGNNRYYDSATNTAFDFDPLEQKASNAQSHSLDTQNADLIQKLNKALRAHADEHYPSATVGVFPAENDSKIALVLVSNKYSPNNFWYASMITPWESTRLRQNTQERSLARTLPLHSLKLLPLRHHQHRRTLLRRRQRAPPNFQARLNLQRQRCRSRNRKG